jgi:hypothetical protein
VAVAELLPEIACADGLSAYPSRTRSFGVMAWSMAKWLANGSWRPVMRRSTLRTGGPGWIIRRVKLAAGRESASQLA